MNVFNWFRKSKPETRSFENPSYPLNSPYGTPPTLAGVVVNEFTAMQYPTLFACINRLSSDLASLKFGVYERLPAGGKAPAFDHPIDKLIRHSPDGIRPAFKFWQTACSLLLRWGNCYIEIHRSSPYGPVEWLELLPPDKIVVDLDDDVLRYKLIGTKHPRTIDWWNILHFCGLGYDGVQGYSPLRMMAQSIGIAISADTTMASYFGNSAKPGGYLSHPGKLTELAAKTLREEWEILTSGPTNAGRTAVLQEGMAWNPNSLPAPDQAFLASRQWQPEEQCRIYLMPPTKVGIYDHATFSNLEQSDLDYRSTLIPWVNSITGEMHHKLLLGADRSRFFFKAHYQELMKADTVAQNAMIATCRQWGVKNVDELRDEIYDMNPLPDGQGQIYVSPANMFTAQQVVQQTQAPPPAIPAPQQPNEPPSTSPRAASAVRAVVLDSLGRMVRREITAVRKASSKPDFKAWLPTFYEDHRALMIEALSPAMSAHAAVVGSGDAATLTDQWIVESETELTELADAISSDALLMAVDDLMERWEKRLTGVHIA